MKLLLTMVVAYIIGFLRLVALYVLRASVSDLAGCLIFMRTGQIKTITIKELLVIKLSQESLNVLTSLAQSQDL